MLIEIAQRLNEFILIHGGQVYRFSDDAFIVVQESHPNGVEEINEFISKEITASNGEVIHLTASVGVTITTTTNTVDSLLHQADAAMCIAKNNGGDQWFQYDVYANDQEC